MNFLKKLLWRPTNHPIVQLLRYGLVVCIAFPIDFGLLYIFTEYVHLHYLLSTILAFSISMLVNFLISVLWVFRNRAERPLWKEITAFFIIGFVGLGLTAIIVWFCTDVLRIYYMISKLIAVSFVFFWSFSARRLLFARHTQDYLNVLRGVTLKARFISLIRSPAFIVLLICLGLILFNLISTYRLRPFNSDDIFWQAILLQWYPFDGSTTTLGNSSVYVDKIPYFEIFNYFFEPSRKVLLIQAALAATAGFAGFYLASLYFLKKTGARLSYSTLIPFVWLSSFGFSFIQLYLNTNWRGFQLGVSFVTFALIAALLYGDITLRAWWSKFLMVALAAYAGLQIYSDPYFLYFTIGPLILLSLVLFVFRKISLRQFALAIIPMALSLLFTKAWAALSYAAGIRTTIEYPMEFIHFENIGDGIGGSLHSILIIFGADFFGLRLNELPTIVPLTNFLLLSIAIIATGAFLLKLRRAAWRYLRFDAIWPAFFIGVSLLVFISHSFSTLGQGTFTYRYFLLFTLLLSLLLAFFMGHLKNGSLKYCLAGLLIIAALFNTTLTAWGHHDAARPDVTTNRANALNYHVITILKDRDYQKGYANYWDANISTYLSGGKISFLPSVCNDRQAQKWHWLINDNAFDKKASKSFYFLNPETPAACTPNNVARQFGPAKDTIKLGNKTLYLYDYDITPRLGVAGQ